MVGDGIEQLVGIEAFQEKVSNKDEGASELAEESQAFCYFDWGTGDDAVYDRFRERVGDDGLFDGVGGVGSMHGCNVANHQEPKFLWWRS